MPDSLRWVDYQGQLSVDPSGSGAGYGGGMKSKDAERAEIERRRRASDKVIGDRLAEARRLAKLTGQQVADLLGYSSKAHVGHLESGRTPVKASDIVTLAESYGQSADWLVLGRRPHGLTPDAARLVTLFGQLGEEDQKFVIETAEDRLRRARSGPTPRKRRAA